MTTTISTPSAALPLILLPFLDDTAPAAVMPYRVGGGILAAYDPARITRDDAVFVLATLYGAPVEDVTPADASIPCNSCGGRGRWVETTHGPGGTVIQVERTCTRCGGTGRVG